MEARNSDWKASLISMLFIYINKTSISAVPNFLIDWAKNLIKKYCGQNRMVKQIAGQKSVWISGILGTKAYVLIRLQFLLVPK
jgi:hypothetical protein